ncbi:MAG TPA: hypothetical protein EYQ30_08025 [Gammaproteobacteria bacterium]|nr:hypothetical protein [Gammaproteobacteria bacterium]
MTLIVEELDTAQQLLLSSELQEHLQRFVNYYNHERYHESLDNVTPADVYYGRRNDILDQRAIIKSRTLIQRKVQNLQLAG